MASSVSRTEPETAVTATMLTTLWVAIKNTVAAGDACAVAFALLRFDLDGVRFATMGFPANEERVGQARFGCLTLTRSLSRLSPDLEPTIACTSPRKLKRPGKPKLTRGHGLRF